MAGPRIAPSLAGYIPAPAGSGPQVAPRRGILSELENLSYGIGQGQVSQLEGYEAMIRQPAAVIAALYRAASNPRQTITAMAADAMQKARGGPIGIGQLLGESFSPRTLLGVNAATTAMNKPGLLQELDVYHGTPHRFPPTEANPLGEFDASKIGTGEGAQAYGHGVYLAEAPEVAKGYATTLANRDSANQGRLNAHANAKRLANLAGESKAAADDIRYALESEPNHSQKELLTQTLQMLESGEYKQPLKNTGSLYKVDLPDEMIDRMLDWDKPLSEQSAAAQQLTQQLRAMPGDPYNLERYFNPKNPNKGPLGQEIYRAISEHFEKNDDAWQSLGMTPHQTQNIHDAASRYASKLGIPGIKYLDAGSRDGGSGTRNFVVFPGEEKRVRILKRE